MPNWVDEYFERAYEDMMRPYREEAARLRATLPSAYRGRGLAASSGWERRARAIDVGLLRGGQQIASNLALEKARVMREIAERRRAEAQARRAGWGRVIGTAVGGIGGFIAGGPAGASAGAGIGAGIVGGAMGGQPTVGTGMPSLADLQSDPKFQETLAWLRNLFGLNQPPAMPSSWELYKRGVGNFAGWGPAWGGP